MKRVKFLDTPEAKSNEVTPGLYRVTQYEWEVMRNKLADLKWDVRFAWSMAGASFGVSIITLLYVLH